jgi:hypothetical protein
MKRVFMAGEWRNELGGWYDEPPYRDESFQGVIEALLRKAKSEGWEIVDALPWRKIRKLQVGGHASAETKNVMGVVLRAKEKSCHVVAFTRDQNGERERVRRINEGIDRSRSEFRDCPAIAGGAAVRKLESWVVALLGEAGSEELTRPEEFLELRGIGDKDTRAMVEAVAGSEMDGIPEDAASLRGWLERARAALED